MKDKQPATKSGIFSFLKPDPPVEPIKDPNKIKKEYKYWRTRVMYTTMIGYAVFYFVRKNLPMAMPYIETDLGISKTDLGLFLTLHGVMYGTSKFFNGYLGDQANPRYFMAIGLVFSAISNILFGLSGAVFTFGMFWLINGYFQGMGFPPCARSITNWYGPSERGVWFSIWNTSHSIGGAIIPILAGYILLFSHGNWRFVFFIPAGIAILTTLFIINRLRDTPPSLGLPHIEEFKGDVSHEVEEEIKTIAQKRTHNQFIVEHVFKNPLIWFLSIANFFVYVVRYAIDWIPTYLHEVRGFEMYQAGWMVACYEISGIVGMLVGGLISDKLFKSYAGRTSLLYMMFCGFFVFMMWRMEEPSKLQYLIYLCGAGFFIYGPQCLVGVIAANLSTKRAAATAIGLTGFFGYLSTSCFRL